MLSDSLFNTGQSTIKRTRCDPVLWLITHTHMYYRNIHFYRSIHIIFMFEKQNGKKNKLTCIELIYFRKLKKINWLVFSKTVCLAALNWIVQYTFTIWYGSPPARPWYKVIRGKTNVEMASQWMYDRGPIGPRKTLLHCPSLQHWCSIDDLCKTEGWRSFISLKIIYLYTWGKSNDLVIWLVVI